jgi:hypothetical protein
MSTMEDTPAVRAIHPAKALVCVGRILYCAPLRVIDRSASWRPLPLDGATFCTTNPQVDELTYNLVCLGTKATSL